MCDYATPSTSFGCNDDLTSILNHLENNTIIHPSCNINEIEALLDEITQWLYTTVLRVAKTGDNETSRRISRKVLKLQEASYMIYDQAKIERKFHGFPLQCKVCDVTVINNRKKKFWNNLQNHEHIEQLWANYLAGDVDAVQMAREKQKKFVFDDDIHRNYDRTVLMNYFPEEFTIEVTKIDQIDLSVVFRGTGWSCLLCRISGTLSDTAMMDHIRGARHTKKSQDERARTALSLYHKNFTKLPPNYQAHLIYFLPKSYENCRCRMCSYTVPYNELQTHILNPSHRDRILKRWHRKKPVRDILLDKACSVYQNENSMLEPVASTSNSNVDDLKEEILQSVGTKALRTNNMTDSNETGAKNSTVAVRNNMKLNDQSSIVINNLNDDDDDDDDDDKPAVFKFNFVIPEDDTTEEPSAESLSYDPLVVDICYPKRLTAAGSKIDNNMPYYTIQMKGLTDSCCLLCRCVLENRFISIKTHLKGARHQKYVMDKKRVLSVKAYHIAFMRLPFELQTHLIYFQPVAEQTAKCVLCSQLVNYDVLESHILGDTHKMTILERLRSGTFELKELLLKYAAGVYLKGNSSEQSEESGSNSNVTNSPTHNGVKDATRKTADRKLQMVHDIVKSITNPESTSFFDRLENRFRSHLNLLEERPSQIYCKCCDCPIEKTHYEVKKHIISQSHKEKAGVTNKKYSYRCDICSYIHGKEALWQEHLKLDMHVKRWAELPPSRRDHIVEYECRTCDIIVFGDALSLRKHSLFKERIKKNKVITLNENVRGLFKSENHINSVSTQYVLDANSVVEFQNNVWACCKALEVALSKIFPKCQAYPFGSRVSGLGNHVIIAKLINSDLDVFVDIGDMYLGRNKQDARSQEKIVKDATKAFKAYPGRVFTHINAVPTARTPIVQVFHTLTQLDCDLSFRHGLSVENTKFLRVCILLQPITQHLILMLKKWSQCSKLDENITTYALSMMTIFYLQTRGLLLSVKQLKELNLQPCLVIDGWETINYTTDLNALKSSITPYTGSLKQLLCDFFKYYSEFKYETEVVCPLLGHTIPKSSFSGLTGENLPREMGSYIVKLRTEEAPELFRALSPFCVQDPFDLSHNLTKACAQHIVNKLKTLCELSLKFLEGVK